MNDTSLQGLLERAATEQEPPVAAIVSNALLAGRRLQRRRRIRGAACGLAAAAAVAAGVPALAGSLGGPAGQAPSPAQAGASSPPASRPAHPVPVPGWFAFVNPAAVPAQHPSGDLVPVTAKSAELLLLDLLPASTTHLVSSQAANAHDGTEVTAQVDPRSTAGTGTAIAAMSRTRVSHLPSCASQITGQYGDLACRTYHLPGGVSVQETLLGSTPSPKGGADRYIAAVTVLRAGGLAVSVQASSYRFDTFHEKGLTTSPPMTVSQLVKAAADPRWSLRMPRAFVASARSVRLPGPRPKG